MAHSHSHRHRHRQRSGRAAGAAGRRSEYQRSSVAATAAAAEDDAAAAVPPPQLLSVLLLSVGVSSVSCLHRAHQGPSAHTHSHTLKNCVKCLDVEAGPGPLAGLRP